MAPDHATAIIAAAFRLAVHAPAKRAPNVLSATVPWDDVEELRRALEDAGIDWRTPTAGHRARMGYKR